MTLKIVKEIHTYSGGVNIKFVIHRKSFLIGWSEWYNPNREYFIEPEFNKSYDTFEKAENDIIEEFSKGLGGIIKIDNGIYTLSKYSLPLP